VEGMRLNLNLIEIESQQIARALSIRICENCSLFSIKLPGKIAVAVDDPDDHDAFLVWPIEDEVLADQGTVKIWGEFLPEASHAWHVGQLLAFRLNLIDQANTGCGPI